MIKIKEGMPVEEYKRRIDALESAKACSALEGFVLHPQDEAIIIEKNKRSMAVLVSYEEYERLSTLEDRYWAQRANEAAKEGFLGPDESMSYLTSKVNAETRP